MEMKSNTILENIVQAVQTLNEQEQKELLKRIEIINYVKQDRKPLVNYDSSKIKAPTMAQINKWKHESRKVK